MCIYSVSDRKPETEHPGGFTYGVEKSFYTRETVMLLLLIRSLLANS